MKRLAIVTGATSGIGRATAVALAGIGCDLVISARRETELNALKAQLSSVQVTACKCEISDPSQVEQLAGVAREGGKEHYPVLVNCAGAAHFGPFAESSVEEILAQLDVNLRGPALLCHALLPWMLEAAGGQIINVLSMAASQAIAGAAAYCASKTGLLALGRCISAEYRKQGIRVTSILPGSVDTPIWDAQSFTPPREDMLTPEMIAEEIVRLVEMPQDRNVDELTIMPPKGFL